MSPTEPHVPHRPATATEHTAHRAPPPQPRLHSDDLFVAGPVIEIAHGDAIYRLRRTSLGKLILTK